jgi:hypothetical protein
MKKIIFSLILSALIIPVIVSARSGCCSHHGGVQSSGCGCNDGTPLSATCAPYYSCIAPISQPKPIIIPSCPVNSTTSSSGVCNCNVGYEKIYNSSSSWSCNIKKIPETTNIIKEPVKPTQEVISPKIPVNNVIEKQKINTEPVNNKKVIEEKSDTTKIVKPTPKSDITPIPQTVKVKKPSAIKRFFNWLF